ncbi:hypothetical protein BG004_005747 [Podila humilis]|nr:hypothetical protein BG004_005747 [Podila humilis]
MEYTTGKANRTEPTKKKPADIKPLIGKGDPFERKQIMSYLTFENSIVSLDVGRATKNISTAVNRFKLRELNSVKFKRCRTEQLPHRLLITTASTSDYLSEVHSLFGSKDNVERLDAPQTNWSMYRTWLSPIRGAETDFATHIQEVQAHGTKARQRESNELADSLPCMVGGSLGEKKNENDIAVIGIGLERFTSTSRLSSLHGTFGAFFVQKAHSLGYLVVGVNEFFTFKNHVEKQERPRYLQPVDKDGRYLWIDHGGISVPVQDHPTLSQ